jgi:probable phosphoglycerate mutase
VKIVEALNDADCGRWQGLTSKEVEREYPELYMDWHEKPGEFRFPGGETLEQVRSRAMRFVQDKVMRCREGSVALVSHRLVLKVLICALLGLDNSFIWNFQLDTGGISRFSYDGRRVVLIVHNDTTYLKSVGSYRPVDF